MSDNRDSLDFGKMNIPRLFVKLFVPTLMGLIFGAILNIADGIFVGRGVGSDALAAVNVAAPIFLVSTGVSLLFGTGVSIVAAVHLSRGKDKAARINVTQAFTLSAFLLAIVSAVIFLFPDVLCYLFGGTERLEPYVVDYLHGVSPTPFLSAIMFVGMFVIRLDGSPKYAMMCNAVCSVLNIFLDWLFVFPFGWGISGAAIATSISEGVAAIGVLAYMTFLSNRLGWYRPKFTRTAISLTLRNAGYMVKLGMSTFIGETAIVCMIIVGNFMFVRYLHEDGVAAFSVACYLFPLVFMFGNSIAQSSLPIVSYNYGQHNGERISRTFRLTVGLATVLGLLMTFFCMVESETLMSLFLDSATAAHAIGVRGFPYFALGFVLFTLNIVLIGFYQSIERPRIATTMMLLRGVVFVIPCFIIMPLVLGEEGLWLAVPTSEAFTFLIIVGYIVKERHGRHGV